jgi:hypothetical protein
MVPGFIHRKLFCNIAVMDTNITQAFFEAIDYPHVKHIIRSNKSIKSYWGGKTPSIADLKRVITNMWKRVSEHESAEDCVNGIVMIKNKQKVRIDFLYLSYSLRTEESLPDTLEDSQQGIVSEL